jgi:hypothetical protein
VQASVVQLSVVQLFSHQIRQESRSVFVSQILKYHGLETVRSHYPFFAIIPLPYCHLIGVWRLQPIRFLYVALKEFFCHRLRLTLFVAFILYRQHYQAQVVALHPGLANPEISKIIGEQWRDQAPEVKSDWKRLAEVHKILCFFGGMNYAKFQQTGRETTSPASIPRI